MNPLAHLVTQTLNPREFVRKEPQRKPKTSFSDLSGQVKLQILQSTDCVEIVCDRFNITEVTYYRIFRCHSMAKKNSDKQREINERNEIIRAFTGTVRDAEVIFGLSKATISRIRNCKT